MPGGGEIETTISGDTFTFDAEGNITEIDGISTVGDNAPSTLTNEGDVRELEQENAANGNGGNGNGGNGQQPSQERPSANVQKAADQNVQQQAEADAQAQARAAAKGQTDWTSPATGTIVTEDADTGEVLDQVSNLRGRNPVENHVEANGPRATPRIIQRLANRGYQGNIRVTVIAGKPFCASCRPLIPSYANSMLGEGADGISVSSVAYYSYGFTYRGVPTDFSEYLEW